MEGVYPAGYPKLQRWYVLSPNFVSGRYLGDNQLLYK
jgi:hypothetical protein